MVGLPCVLNCGQILTCHDVAIMIVNYIKKLLFIKRNNQQCYSGNLSNSTIMNIIKMIGYIQLFILGVYKQSTI